VRLKVDGTGYPAEGRGELGRAPFTTSPVLTDGGVYDNLGLETAWKRYETVLVSDGGGQMQPEEKVHSDWARHSLRVNALIDNQVRNLRKRQVIGAFKAGERTGAYWGIRTDIDDYELASALSCPSAQTRALAATKTRLERMPDALQERLINWGYGVCDAAMRKHVDAALPAPQGFPYPDREVG
jgi:NTE family protein